MLFVAVLVDTSITVKTHLEGFSVVIEMIQVFIEGYFNEKQNKQKKKQIVRGNGVNVRWNLFDVYEVGFRIWL